MADIYTEQELYINFTDAQSRDMEALDLRVDYWQPSNITDTPDGTLDSDDFTYPSTPVLRAKIAAGILTPYSINRKTWRFQIIDNTSGVGWTTVGIIVLNRGSL